MIPPYGGDTQWSNTVAAYEGLSAPLQRLADGRRAVHRFSPPDGTTATEDYERRVRRRPLLTEHPVVRVHPETGEKALYVNPGFTTHIEGVSAHESRRLLGLFYDELARPEYTVRFKWEPGSIAFWDNRSTVHLAPTDLTWDLLIHLKEKAVGPLSADRSVRKFGLPSIIDRSGSWPRRCS